jgi:hypothetical protein
MENILRIQILFEVFLNISLELNMLQVNTISDFAQRDWFCEMDLQ